ncbi:unnamed protein product, partial [Onchocerca ochengi]
CFREFDTNLRYGCKTFDWRPRFFYNQTSSKCEMFWYDASCPKTRKFTNMFYHRGACKRLCQSSDQTTRKLWRQTGVRRIGQISAMLSQPYNSVPLFRDQKLIRMQKIFDDFFVDAHIKPIKSPISVKATLSETSNADQNHTLSIGIVLK